MATIPIGYAPEKTAQSFTSPDEPPTGFLGGPVFVNMLQYGDESVVDTGELEEDGLPETGAGQSHTAGTGTLSVTLAVGVAMLGAAAISMRASSRC